jgi:predicted Zn-dependent peptidase
MRRTRWVRGWLAGLAALSVLVPVALAAEQQAKVPVETFTLDNGMEFLLVQKPEMTTVSAGWVAHVGSANERPGITGIAHFFEHMMFKGSHTIGTTNIERDLEIIAEQEALQEKIRQEYREQRERWRRGEIEDPYAPDARTPELVELEKQFQELVEEQRELMVKDEFDQVYTEAGASGMNAFTNQDMTVFFVTVPANKAELWFWMESDRLKNLVPREFYSERDVVHEERRLRTESTPTGEFDELFNAMFWQSHPYSWPVIGWPSDLRSYTKAQAEEFYDTYYRAGNVTAAIVGNFDPAEVKQLAQKYFGRLERGPVPPDVVTLEMEQKAEKRMTAECDCQPQIRMLYHTVPFRHADSYALSVLAELMSGRTGRLYKSLVLDKGIATSAGASQNSSKWAGSFRFGAEAKGDATPAELEAAIAEELRRISEEPIPAEELQKVKNQIAAAAFRQLENPFFLMIQLLYYDGLGDWSYINDWSQKTLAVTAEDVQRVAKEYLTEENRAIAHYFRKAGTTPGPQLPPELAGLPEQARQQLINKAKEISTAESLEQLRTELDAVREQKGQLPPQALPMIEYIEKLYTDRITELEAEAEAGQGGE